MSSAESVEEIVIDQDKLKNPRISAIAHLAHKEGVTIKEATKERVSALSKNPRQDQVRGQPVGPANHVDVRVQGIVAKVKPLNIIPLENYLSDIKFGPSALVALDGVWPTARCLRVHLPSPHR